ncbi:hypothetical protein F4X90_06360 [Candidatus Poribacteria bacterium]|nr:hypothetical protein [Candidatus Poribacteria bacterium]
MPKYMRQLISTMYPNIALKIKSGSVVYFTQNIRDRQIKIGWSMSFDTRRRQLSLDATRETQRHQKNNQHRYHFIRCLWIEPGNQEREKELHEQFSSARIRNATNRNSEYFRMDDNLCAYLTSKNPRLTLLSTSGTVHRAHHPKKHTKQ